MKKVLLLLLVMSMVFAVFAGCNATGPKQSGTTATKATEGTAETKTPGEALLNTGSDFPITKEKVTLSMAIRVAAYDKEDLNQMWFFKHYEELTNVHWEFQRLLNSEWTEKKNLMMAGGTYPDVIWCKSQYFSPVELSRYGSEGIFLDLRDYFKYTPNFLDVMDLVEGSWDYITCPDGGVYSFAYVNPISWNPGTYITINSKYLNNAGIMTKSSGIDNIFNYEERPSTIDEFYQALVAIKNQDSKLIPLSTVWSTPIVWYTAFGYDTNEEQRYVGFDTLNNKNLVFLPMEPRYKEMLQYLRKLYNEGLLDKDSFTQDKNQLNAKGNEHLLGSYYNGDLPFYVDPDNYEYYLELMLGYNDSAPRITASATKVRASTAMITNKCKYPEVAARWIDIFYTNEHNFNIMYGPAVTQAEVGTDKDPKDVLNAVITLDEQGNYVTIAGNPEKDELAIKDLYAYYAVDHPVNGMHQTTLGESYCFSQLFKGVPKTKQDRINKQLYFINNLTFEDRMRKDAFHRIQKTELGFDNQAFGVPTVYLTDDQQDWMNEYATILRDYVSTMEAKFITGAYDLDADYDGFLAELKKLGAENYLKIYKEAYGK